MKCTSEVVVGLIMWVLMAIGIVSIVGRCFV